MRALPVLLALGFSCSVAPADAPKPAIAPGISIAPAVPMGNPVPTLMIAKIDNGNLVTEAYKQVSVQKEVAVTRVVNGETVTEKVTVTVFEMVVVQQQLSMKGAKATSGGKALSEKELAEKLSENKAVVTSVGPIGEKYKGVFKDDAILIEFPKAAVVQPPLQPGVELKVLPLPPKG